MQIFKDMKTSEYDDFIGVYEMVIRNLVWVLDVTEDSKNSKRNITCDIKLKCNLCTQDMQDGFSVTELYNNEEKKEELKNKVSDMLKNLFDNHFGISNKIEVINKCPCIGNDFLQRYRIKDMLKCIRCLFPK